MYSLTGNVEVPSASVAVDTPSANINAGGEMPSGPEADISGPSGEVKLKSSGSFIDKLGGIFKSGKKDGDKRAKKRKRTKDSNLDLNADLSLPSADVSVDGSADAAGKRSISGESDFIVVDTPTMPKKEGEGSLDLGTGPSVGAEGELDFNGKGPKSPSLLRRIGMFFHIGGKSYNIDGEKKKKRRKVSVGSKDTDAEVSGDVSVKRDDSFTIPDAEFKAPSLGISTESSAAGNTDASSGLSSGISGSAQAELPSVNADAKVEGSTGSAATVDTNSTVKLPSVTGIYLMNLLCNSPILLIFVVLSNVAPIV